MAKKAKGHKDITIIGGGALGSAFVHLLGERAHVWDIHPERTTVNKLEEAITTSSTVFLCIPSWVNRAAIMEIQQIWGADTENKVIITMAKGTEPGFITMEQVLAEQSKNTFAYGVLYGPMLAGELAQGLGGTGTLALNNPKLSTTVSKLFKGTELQIETSKDLRGTTLCGVLKNIYALGFGIYDALEQGYNAKSQLFLEIVRESQTLLKALGGKPETIFMSCGIADMLTTGWSGSSYNYRIGYKLGLGEDREELTSEGTTTLINLAAKHSIKQYPIIHTLHEIILGNKDPKDLLYSQQKR